MKVKRVIIDYDKWEVRMENGTVWHLYKKDVLEFSHEEYGELLNFLGRLTHVGDIPLQELQRYGFYKK